MSCDTREPIVNGETPEDRLEQRGGRKAAEKALRDLRRVMKERGPEALADIGATVSIYRPWAALGDVLSDVWFNSVLSGPITHAVNFISNTTFMLYRPLPQMAGGALMMPFRGVEGAQAFRNGVREYAGIMHAYRELLNLKNAKDPNGILQSVKKAAQEGEGVLMRKPGVLAERAMGKIETSAKGIHSNNMLVAAIFNGLGLSPEGAGAARFNKIADYTVRGPSRALQAADEFSKQIAARARFQAKYTQLINEKYPNLPSQEKARLVQDGMERGFKDGVALTQSHVAAQAAEEVRQSLVAANMDITSLSRKEAKQVREATVERFKELMESNNLYEVTLAMEAGVERALDISFTKNLRDQRGVIVTTGQIAQEVRAKAMPLQFVIPFVQTPTNILKASVDHSPIDGILGMVEFASYKMKKMPATATNIDTRTKFASDMFSGDADRQADAIGRFALASATTLTAYNMALNWMDQDASFGIVGSPPRDYREAQNWANAKVQFNSIFWKNEDGSRTYIPLSRLEPFSSFIGVVADITTAGYFADPDDDEYNDGVSAVISSTIASLTNNFVNKSYATGLQDFMEVAMSGEGNKIQRYFSRLGASIAVPALVSQTGRAINPEYRDERGFIDTVLSKTGWFADRVAPRRNALGEVRKRFPAAGADMMGRWVSMVSPFTYSESSRSPVDRELARLGEVFGAPKPKRSIEKIKVDLLKFKNEAGQTAYDRWQEITSTAGPPTLREKLKQVITSDEYKALSERSEDGVPSEKAAAIRSIIQRYRNVSFDKMLQSGEFPEIIEYLNGARERGRTSQGRAFPDQFGG